MFKTTPNNSRNDLEYVRSFKRDFPSWSPTVALLPPPPGIIGQFLLLGHDAGGIDWHEEKVRLRRVLRATGAVQQKLVHEDLRGKRWGDWWKEPGESHIFWYIIIYNIYIYMYILHGHGSWWFMMVHDGSWCFMMLHDASWCFMMLHDASWWFMMVHDGSCRELHVVLYRMYRCYNYNRQWYVESAGLCGTRSPGHQTFSPNRKRT